MNSSRDISVTKISLYSNNAFNLYTSITSVLREASEVNSCTFSACWQHIFILHLFQIPYVQPENPMDFHLTHSCLDKGVQTQSYLGNIFRLC